MATVAAQRDRAGDRQHEHGRERQQPAAAEQQLERGVRARQRDPEEAGVVEADRVVAAAAGLGDRVVVGEVQR
jgi:hypothetical protein